MRKYLLVALSASALTFASQTVHAADFEAPPASYDWTGFYAGVTAGYGWGDHTQIEDGGDSGKHNMEGFVAGGTLGYNMQMDPVVLGFEADLSYSDIDGEFNSALGWGCGGGVPDVCRTDIEWFGTARVRLGLPIESVMPYVTGGLAFGGVSSEIVNDPSYQVDKTDIGWTVGGGVEAAVSESLTVKAEVLYVDFGKTGSNTELTVDTNFTVGRLGLNWQF